MKILLVSHGKFAEGLRDTMVDFFGATNIYAACVTQENGTDGLRSAVEEYLAGWAEDEQVIICSDMMGGSANQTVYPYMARPNTYLVAGMNLPLVMQLHLEPDGVSAEFLREIIEISQSGIVLVNDKDFSAVGEYDE